MYVYHIRKWPAWEWDDKAVNALLLEVIAKQNLLLGKLSALGFGISERTALETGILDVLNNSEIEGEKLQEEYVRSSIAKKLGLDIGKEPQWKSEETEGAINMFLDATKNYEAPLKAERMLDWHAGLFPTGRSGGVKIDVAKWRTSPDSMQIVSGAMGKETVHYQAPDAKDLRKLMNELIKFSNTSLNSKLPIYFVYL